MFSVEHRRRPHAPLEGAGLVAPDRARVLHRVMLLARRLDAAEAALRKTNEVFFHIPGAGHEAVQAALGTLLSPATDWFVAYYRDRALMLALGMTPLEMMLAAVGSVEDPGSAGRQIPSNWSSPRLHVMSRSSCTGTQFLQAVGVARGGREIRARSGRGLALPAAPREIVYCSAGDGTAAQGEFWEGLMRAVAERLPLIVVIQDNGYAISTPSAVQYPGGDIARLVRGVPGLIVRDVDGADVRECLAVLGPVVEAVRGGAGPALVRARVPKVGDHSVSDDQRKYRSGEEIAAGRAADPIGRIEAWMEREGFFARGEGERVRAEVDREVEAAIAGARAARRPEGRDAATRMYGEMGSSSGASGSGGGRGRGSEGERGGDGERGAGALDAVIDAIAARDPRVVRLAAGSATLGEAVGMAMRGVRPALALDGVDAVWRAMMHVRNEMATVRWRSAGAFACPMLVRVAVPERGDGAAGLGETLLPHLAGLRVVAPSTFADAAGLAVTALAGEDPVVMLEPRAWVPACGEERDTAAVPLGQLRRVRGGGDVTLVTWGASVAVAVDAAAALASDGVGVDVLDLRSLAPWDVDGVLASVARTGRLAVVHHDTVTAGFGAEVAAVVGERGFASLARPVVRVGAGAGHPLARPGARGVAGPAVADVVAVLRDLTEGQDRPSAVAGPAPLAPLATRSRCAGRSRWRAAR